jgi:thiamine-monophosphate kinase
MLEQSDVGAEVDLNRVPVHDDAFELAKTSGKSAIQHALSDGEDFELLLTMTEKSWSELNRDNSFDFELHSIGRVVDRHCGKIIDAATGGDIAIAGYEH